MSLLTRVEIAECAWPVSPHSHRSDHGYALFGALCRAGLLFHGQPDTQAILTPRRLVIRAPLERAWRLAGAGPMGLLVGDRVIECGCPAVRPLVPSPSLDSEIVTIEHATSDELMRAAVAKSLGLMGVECKIRAAGRRVFRVRGATIVGYAVRLGGLTEAGSIEVQARGVGGRNRMGCGVFVPC